MALTIRLNIHEEKMLSDICESYKVKTMSGGIKAMILTHMSIKSDLSKLIDRLYDANKIIEKVVVSSGDLQTVKFRFEKDLDEARAYLGGVW